MCIFTLYIDRRRTLTGVYDKDVDVVLKTSNTAQPPPPPPSVRHSANESDDDDDVTASARSRSPSSDVENILEALRDTTTTYYGDFTLRRVFSLEEELITSRTAAENGSSASAERGNPETTAATQADRVRHENDGQSIQTVWTLPLARRATSAAIGRTLTSVIRRFNGFAQGRTTADDDDRFRLPGKSGVSASATAIHGACCPVNVAEYLYVKSPTRPDKSLSTSPSVEKDPENHVVPSRRTLCVDLANPDASTTACDHLSGDNKRYDEQIDNGCIRVETNRTPSITTSFSCASANLSKVQDPELELSGIPCSISAVVSGKPCQNIAATTSGSKVVATPKVNPIQRSSSNRDASRPPIQPRTSSPSGGHWRRSATPSRASVDCLPGLTTVGVSRTSSCEVLVDDDESRLNDIISRRGGVSRRSSFASSVADDCDSTAASETDSLAACFDIDDDRMATSLLDRLLLRLRPTPRDSPSNCGRRQSTQTSISWSSDEDIDLQSAVDVASRHPLPSWINHKHSSLLSSLDDFTSDSDFELGSSLSQLMMTSGNPPHRALSSRNNDRLPGQAASIADLPRHTGDHQLNKYSDWLENYTYVPPRTALDRRSSANGELVTSATSGLSAPITESPPAEIHIARTSRIPKY